MRMEQQAYTIPKATDIAKLTRLSLRFNVEQPCLKNITVFDHQVKGIDWMLNKWHKQTNVILADV